MGTMIRIPNGTHSMKRMFFKYGRLGLNSLFGSIFHGLGFLAVLIATFSSSSLLAQDTPTTNHNYWVVEDALARARLPLYKFISPAKPSELTPANGYPKPKTFLTWHRSHGDNGGMRYSGLAQINRQNVTNLQVAWIYHSRDGSNNLQCNPIIVRGIMIAPTAGKFIVGVDAENGNELWRFKPEGQP